MAGDYPTFTASSTPGSRRTRPARPPSCPDRPGARPRAARAAPPRRPAPRAPRSPGTADRRARASARVVRDVVGGGLARRDVHVGFALAEALMPDLHPVPAGGNVGDGVPSVLAGDPELRGRNRQ